MSIKRRRILIVTLILALVLLGGFGINKLIINKDITSNSYEAKANVNVKFDANGGKISGKNSVTYARNYMGGYKAPTPTGPKNYKFEGWYTAKKGGTKVTSLTKINTKTAHTLYAHWGITYEVTFNKNGAKKISDTKKTCYKKNDESYCTVKAPNITAESGFEVLGWGVTSKSTVASEKVKKDIPINNNTTFYAVTKSKSKYLAYLDRNGSVSTSTKIVGCYRYNGQRNCSVNLPSIIPSPGFEALGWSKAKNAILATVKQGKSAVLNQDVVTYYAITKSKEPYVAGVEALNTYSVAGKKNYFTELKCYRYNGSDSCNVTLPKGISTYTKEYNGKKCISGGNDCKGYTVNGWACSDYETRKVYKEGATLSLKQNNTNKAMSYEVSCYDDISKVYDVKFNKGNADSIVTNGSKILNRYNPVRFFDPDYMPYVYSKGNSVTYTTTYKKNSDVIKSISFNKSDTVKNFNVYKDFKVLNMAFEVEKGISYNYYTQYKKKMEEVGKYMPWLFYSKAKVFLYTEKSYLKLDVRTDLGYTAGETAGLASSMDVYDVVRIRGYDSYGEDRINVTVHELGHTFDYYYKYKTGMKISDQPDIVELYNKYKAYKKNRPISAYAYTDEGEFVAEITAAYYTFKYNKIKNTRNYNLLPNDIIKAFEYYINNAKAMYKGNIK